MFTGIVRGIGEVSSVTRHEGLSALEVSLPQNCARELNQGASISVDGVCLTVSSFQGLTVRFDLMLETLNKTTLGRLESGSKVNIERAAKFGDEIGGHSLSGHIDCTVTVVSVEKSAHNHMLRFQVQPEWMRYLFEKGYVALHGASLTIASVDRTSSSFTVWLIPETLGATTLGALSIGDQVNLEIDRNTQAIVDTVRDYLKNREGLL